MHIVTAARRLLLALTMFVACHIVQAQTITQRFDNEPLRKVIHDIERQTHMSFIYKADVIDEQLRVSIHCRNTPIKNVLRTILPPGISFMIEKNLSFCIAKPTMKAILLPTLWPLLQRPPSLCKDVCSIKRACPY